MAVSETLVRECLEQRGLLVRQCRKYVTPHPGAEPDIDFPVVNPLPPAEPVTLPAVLEPADLSRLVRAIVADLIEQVETNRNYQKSYLLQTVRLLKRYGFLRDPHLDLFQVAARRTTRRRDGTP